MADRDAGEDRHAEGDQPLHQGLLDVVAAAVPRAEDDPGHSGEPAGLQQLGQQPIDPVGRLADVLQEDDAPVGPGCGPRRTHGRGQQRQVAADQPPGGPARPQGVGAGQRAHRRRVHQRSAQVVERLGVGLIAAEQMVGRHRPEAGRQPEPSPERNMQRGDVARTVEQLRAGGGQRLPVEQRQDPPRPVPAAGADDRPHLGVGPGRRQVGRPVGVGSGQVAAPVADVRTDDDPNAEAGQPLAPGGQPVGLARPARGHDRHPVARSERSGLGPKSRGHEVSHSLWTKLGRVTRV